METKSTLIAVLLRDGRANLARLLEVSEQEIHKKLNGESGWKLDQLVKVIDAHGAKVLPEDDSVVVVKRDEWTALRTLARKSLEPLDD